MGASDLGQVEIAFRVGAIGAGPTMILCGGVPVVAVFTILVGIKGLRMYRYDPFHPFEAYEGGTPPG